MFKPNKCVIDVIHRRRKYISQKGRQLDAITDAHKYTRRLSHIMRYHKLLTELEAVAVKKITKGGDTMKARILKVKEVGSCNYCEKGELKADGMGLKYPYDEVVEISGNQTVSRLCFECVGKVAALKELH